MRRIIAAGSCVVIALAVVAAVSYRAGRADAAGGDPDPQAAGQPTAMPGFTRVLFLSHVNSPVRIPGFPGDPAFSLRTVFTVPADGFYLQDVDEGEHTGTHYSAPCHFHVDALCANDLGPSDLVLPAVVVNVREKVQRHPEYHVTVKDLTTWRDSHGPFPKDAAVLLRTGCDKWWGPEIGARIKTYYNCGSADGKYRQPGFSEKAVRWLIDQGILGNRGALGSDTFGPDPTDDPDYMESWLALRLHRMTLENLMHLDQMPARGGWIVVGGPRNLDGSGAPSTILGFVP
jgi:kynurenine formamidase